MNNKFGFILALILIICCIICYLIMYFREKYNKIHKSDCYNCIHYEQVHKGKTNTINIYRCYRCYRCYKLNKIDFNKANKRHKFIKCKYYIIGGNVNERR